MIQVDKYFELFKKNDIHFFTGVPDSLLKDFLFYVNNESNDQEHVITANEGSAVGLASGYHLATGKVPLVYMQNSGMGNAVNPLLSLASNYVYNIPMILLIGWRGEPNIKDEPQHLQQGKITLDLLKLMDIPYIIIDEDETEAYLTTEDIIHKAKKMNKPHAIVVRKGSFKPYKVSVASSKGNNFEMSREDALQIVLDSQSGNELIVSTTGKLSRELFEYRENNNQEHSTDFLTIGGMGHASTIALGIARENRDRDVFCLDGDGALLMHAGSLSNIGFSGLSNLKHIVFNNGAHESVGGQKTLSLETDLSLMATANGYQKVFTATSEKELKGILNNYNSCTGVTFIEIKVKMNTRKDLGRPTTTPIENKLAFMQNINKNDQRKRSNASSFELNKGASSIT